MTLQECYAAMEGDYQDALGRLRSDRLVQKFVLKFLADGSYDLLTQSMEEENYAEAFRAAHTIKGVCQNLRNGFTPEAIPLTERVKADYRQTMAAIQAFQKEIEG